MMNSAVKLLDRAAELWPDKVGISDEWESLSFGEWRRQALSVATSLINDGGLSVAINPVIVCMPKSVRALTAFMGILYSGNPYVPVAADVPMARLEKIIENLSPGAIIASAETFDRIKGASGLPRPYIIEDMRMGDIDESAVEKRLNAVIDADPIYIMYTSGSTGTPKGVTVAHRGVLDYAAWVTETFGFGEQTVMGNQAPFYFDNSIFDIYGALLSGARLELIPEALFLFPVKLPEFLEEKGITSIFWVPTVMINVANSGALAAHSLPKLKNVAFCGEVMPNTQLNIWRREHPDCRYANLYGPTEITDVCCWYDVVDTFKDSDILPIGVACKNARLIILNDENSIAAPMETGELCVLGTGVALGYWNASELTERVFVQNPANRNYHESMYRTGDLAYVDDSGKIIFLGRRDSQIKLKGNRIELGEIESAAMCVEGVENACAVFDEPGQRIVLFVETKGTLPFRKFNMELKKYIPPYMLPGALIEMEKLPHTANDKIDRVTLKKSILKEQ